MNDHREKIFSNYLELNKKTIDLPSLGDEVSKIALIFLDSLKNDVKNLPGLTLIKQKLDRDLSLLKDIRRYPSLERQYKTIYMLVLPLLVSNFEDFLKEIFINLSTLSMIEGKINIPDDLKISLNDIKTRWSDFPLILGELILERDRTINFQDLQSTIRTFNYYLDINLQKCLTKNREEKLVYLQACRHAILHSASRIDDKFLNQIRNTRFFTSFKKGQNIDISIGDCMNGLTIMEEFATNVLVESRKVLPPSVSNPV